MKKNVDVIEISYSMSQEHQCASTRHTHIVDTNASDHPTQHRPSPASVNNVQGIGLRFYMVYTRNIASCASIGKQAELKYGLLGRLKMCLHSWPCYWLGRPTRWFGCAMLSRIPVAPYMSCVYSRAPVTLSVHDAILPSSVYPVECVVEPRQATAAHRVA